jgi:hypothetical protein
MMCCSFPLISMSSPSRYQPTEVGLTADDSMVS